MRLTLFYTFTLLFEKSPKNCCSVSYGIFFSPCFGASEVLGRFVVHLSRLPHSELSFQRFDVGRQFGPKMLGIEGDDPRWVFLRNL